MEEEDIFGIDYRIFRERRILSSHYIPKRLIARDPQIREVARIFAPVLQRGEPHNVLIYGKTGVGKTVVAKYVLKKLVDRIQGSDLNIVPVFLNCNRITGTRVILSILQAVDPATPIPVTGLATSEYYKALWKAMNDSQASVIVVLDEIDMLEDQDLLYKISRAGENLDLTDSSITIAGLSNDLYLSEKIDPRTLSSLRSRDLLFPPYNATDLVAILTDRIGAFQDGVLDEDVIPLCAALSAQEHGDARKAIALLETAGEIAERERSPNVTAEHVTKARGEVEMDHLIEMVRSLPLQSKLVLMSIILAMERKSLHKLDTGMVQDHYTKLCQELQIEPLGRTSVSKQIKDLDMMGIIDAPIQYRGRRGRTRVISMPKQMEKIRGALEVEYPDFSTQRRPQSSLF